MNQTSLILMRLREGPLTAIEALEKCGCLRLAARISDLKYLGHNIVTERVHENGKTFARYRLV